MQPKPFREIILPQALPPIVPALGNYLVALFKETPLLSAIAVLVRPPDEATRWAGLCAIEHGLFQELSAMIGNLPLKEITCRLYYQTTRIWLTMVPHLNLPDEIAVFRREMTDILAAMELGDFGAVGHIRRSHISMSVKRMTLFPNLYVSPQVSETEGAMEFQ